MLKKIGFILVILAIIFTSACSKATGVMDNDNEEVSEDIIIKIDGNKITQSQYEDARSLILINNYITQNNISMIKKAIEAETKEEKKNGYKAQLAFEEQKLINDVTNSLVTEEIISRMVLYNEAINYEQAIGPNNANQLAKDLQEKYKTEEYQKQVQVLKAVLESLSIEEDYYWNTLERDNIMYKTSIRNLKNKLAQDYIDNNYSDEEDRPTLSEITKDKNFIEFYETFRHNAIKKSTIRIKRGYN